MIKCDFCGVPIESTRAHVVHCPPLEVDILDNEQVIGGMYSPDNWAACDVCHARLMAKDYDKIIADCLVWTTDADKAFVDEMSSILHDIYSRCEVLQ